MYRRNGKVVGYRAVPTASGMGDPADVRLRRLRKYDREEVLEIDRLTHDAPLNKTALRRLLRDRLGVGIVAIVNENVVAFCVGCEIWNELEIVRLATRPGWRRMGIARSIVSRLKHSRQRLRLDRIFVPVDERNVDAQMCLKAQGFR